MSDATPTRRCFVTGATGLIGQMLVERLLRRGDQVHALSRRAREEPAGVTWWQGDPSEPGPWLDALVACDVVFHLAGEPIADKRWSAAQKQRLVDSRIDSTRLIADAVLAAEQPPTAWVQASAVGYYGARGEEVLDEAAPPGEGFLAGLCVDWEGAALRAAGSSRVVCLRIGIALAADGGALSAMLPPFRLGLGGPLGPSERWFPWVHRDDVVGLLLFAADTESLSGPLNAVAPQAARMGEFAKALGRALHRPAWIPTPIAPLRLVLGEFADHLSPGLHVVPKKALDGGYVFAHPELDEALAAALE